MTYMDDDDLVHPSIADQEGREIVLNERDYEETGRMFTPGDDVYLFLKTKVMTVILPTGKKETSRPHVVLRIERVGFAQGGRGEWIEVGK